LLREIQGDFSVFLQRLHDLAVARSIANGLSERGKPLFIMTSE